MAKHTAQSFSDIAARKTGVAALAEKTIDSLRNAFLQLRPTQTNKKEKAEDFGALTDFAKLIRHVYDLDILLK